MYHPVKIWIVKTPSDFKRWKFNLHEQLTIGIHNNKRRCQDKGTIHEMQTLKPFVDFIIACFTFNKRKNESVCKIQPMSLF